MSDAALIPRTSETVGEAHHVSIGGIDLAHAPDCLVTVLGSCIAVVLYDPFASLAGMAHVLLPDSNGASGGPPGKYADTAVSALIAALMEHGAQRPRLQAQLAGGARMFGAASAAIDVGSSNIRAVAIALAAARIPVAHHDLGGTHGRKAHFDIANGLMTVHTLQGMNRVGGQP